MRRFLIAVLICAPAFAGSWKSEGPFFGNVLSIAVDPAKPDRLWAATHGGGVWRSIDGGKSWQLSGEELSSYVVTFVAIQPKSNTLWAGVEQGALARSKDGGTTWEWIHDNLSYTPHPVAFDPANPKSIWIPDVNLHKRSTDGGEKWSEFRVGGGNVWTFEFHPANPKIIWAGGENRGAGLWKSSDGGTSWKQMIGRGLPESNGVRDLIADPSAPDTLYMRTRRGGFKSVDGGETWSPFGGSFPQSAEIESLTMHPSSFGTLYAGTEKGLFRTTDGGQTWSEIENGLPNYVISALAIHPSNPNIMWAGASGSGIYQSTDGGKSWTAANIGFAASWIEQVWGDTAGTIFAQASMGLFATDGKGGWFEIGEPFSDSKADIDTIEFDSKNPKIVHAGDAWSYYRSADSGASWVEIVKPFQEPRPYFSNLVLDARNPRILYSAHAGADDDEPAIFKSVDGGVKWKPAGRGIKAGVRSLRSDSAGSLLALGREGGLWRSTDGATAWTAIGNGLPSEEMKELAIDPTDAARVYVATEKILFRSEDGGASFSESYKAGDELEVTGSAVDAKGNVYVATREGVFRSADRGKSWSPFTEGLTNKDVRALHSAGTRLYAGTAGGGVFSIDL